MKIEAAKIKLTLTLPFIYENNGIPLSLSAPGKDEHT
jgi:hypothetical protein